MSAENAIADNEARLKAEGRREAWRELGEALRSSYGLNAAIDALHARNDRDASALGLELHELDEKIRALEEDSR